MKEMRPLTAQSLKDQFIERFEQLILAGHFPVGENLPPERELARMLEVSRPVVHEGLVELAAKGLVTIIPRRGTVVNDFRSQGSVELLVSLLRYGSGDLQPAILEGVLEMRLLFESAVARQAAQRRSEAELAALEDSLVREEELYASGLWRESLVAEADYRFHHRLAMASGNLIYPLLMNSFRSLYLNILTRFYREKTDFLPILESHRLLVRLVREGNGEAAEAEMRRLLSESADSLNRILERQR
jgi:GntR family transcriptional regulator, transcriptional repressor for pyruvate dehydrogenase complex